MKIVRKTLRKRAATSKKRLPDLQDPTTIYAKAVVSGAIVAGEFVRAACERHLRDLETGSKRGLVWVPDKAAWVAGFFPNILTVTAGLRAGHPFELLPWMQFAIGSLFGWYRESGRLRFRSAWLETGKGQAKSPLMAGIGIYLGGFHDVQRAEVYSIGQDRNTANVLFKDAVAMCRAPIPGGGPASSLESRKSVVIRGTLDNAWKIEFPKTLSKFQSLANGEAISGPRPVAVLADEIHEFKSEGPLETWRRAIAKMPGDALMIMGTNTPASTQIVGTEYSEFYQKVAKGVFEDDEAFAYIARVDKEDYKDIFSLESVWVKALPALGITFPIENIRGEVATARVFLGTSMSVKRLYFGIPTGAVEFWINEEAWASCQHVVDSRKLKRRPCWLSLDLSQKNDLTALTATWDDEKRVLNCKTEYWTTRSGLEEREKHDRLPYRKWIEAGHITAVDGAVIPKAFVAKRVQELCEENEVQFLAFDPSGIADFEAACEEIGFPVWRWKGPDTPEGVGLKLIAHAQGTRVVFEDKQLCMPRSVEKFEDRILAGTINIDPSPVTYSCAASAVVVIDAQKNRAFDKKRSRGRIDGVVTIAMGVGAALMNEAPKTDYGDFLSNMVAA